MEVPVVVIVAWDAPDATDMLPALELGLPVVIDAVAVSRGRQ